MKALKMRITLLFMVLMVGLFIACSAETNDGLETGEVETNDSAQTTNNENEGEEEESTDEPSEPIDLVIAWSFGEDNFFNNFNPNGELDELFPHITFEIVGSSPGELEELMVQGTTPDLIEGLSARDQQELGLFYDLDELVDRHSFDLSRIEQSSITTFRNQSPNGELRALPFWGGGARVMYYNLDIFDMNGEAYPEDGMTWDEAVDMARRVTGEVDGRAYLGMDFPVPGMAMDQLDTPHLDPDTDEPTYLTHPEGAQQTLELLERIVSIPGNTPTEDMNESMRDRFPEGDVALWPFWNRTGPLAQVEEETGLNWDLVSFPVWEEGGYSSFSPGNSISISSVSDHKDDAFQVIEYILSDEVQERQNRGANQTALADPEIRQTRGADNPILQEKNMMAFFHNEPHPGFENESEYESVASGVFGNSMDEFMTLEQDVISFLRDLEDEVRAAVTEAQQSQ